MKAPAVYILASQRNGTLYTGVTSDLIKRVWEHKNNLAEGFTQKYNTHRLVYYEQHPNMDSAIVREKQIKKWNRQWKLQLIEERNPEWNDLYESLL
ncbi:MAG: GIY-YIG nuclease family protein [Acidiferrobacterales bacterium]